MKRGVKRAEKNEVHKFKQTLRVCELRLSQLALEESLFGQ